MGEPRGTIGPAQDDYMGRMLLVKNRIDALTSEAKSAANDCDLPRVRAIRAEVDLLMQNAYQIREEQLLALRSPKPKRKRRWQR